MDTHYREKISPSTEMVESVSVESARAAAPKSVELSTEKEKPTGKYSFGWERLSFLLKEPNIRDLITSYYQELTPLTGHRLDIDWARLLRHEQEGVYRIWTARVNGTLAGFAAFYVQNHWAHKSVLAALDGGHYLAPAFRGKGMVGWRMWRSAKAALIEEGVQFIMAHDNAKRPLMPFFLALGFEPLSTMWIWTGDEDHD